MYLHFPFFNASLVLEKEGNVGHQHSAVVHEKVGCSMKTIGNKVKQGGALSMQNKSPSSFIGTLSVQVD
jgi:hypothetical protein